MVATWTKNKSHFDNFVHAMQLKITGNVRVTIFLLFMPKPGEIPIFRTILAKLSIFAYISLKIGYL